MRLIGPKGTVPTFRWDLIYLVASLLADNRGEVVALAAPVEALLAELRQERDTFEKSEDLAVLMLAKRERKDETIGRRVVELGGVARAVDKNLYARLFPAQAPSDIAKLGLDKQVLEHDRLIGELAQAPADHPVRVAYEAALISDLGELREAMKASNGADVSLKLGRSRLRAFKMKVDTVRVETHGRLQALLGSRKEADTFFRPVWSAPGEKEEEAEASESATPAAPTTSNTSTAPTTSTTSTAPATSNTSTSPATSTTSTSPAAPTSPAGPTGPGLQAPPIIAAPSSGAPAQG
jgi:hypothetical protein